MTTKENNSGRFLLRRSTIPEKFCLHRDGTVCIGYSKIPADDISHEDFAPLNNNGREVYSFSSTKRFKKGHIKNTPTKIKLAGTAWGSNGLRVPVVTMLSTGHCVTITADIFVEGLIPGELTKDKIFPGKYVVASVCGSYRLIREGSMLHKSIVGNMKRNEKPKIETSKLERGRAYSTPGGNTAVFVGYVCTTAYKPIYEEDSTWKCTEYNKKIIKKATLWLEYSDWQVSPRWGRQGGNGQTDQERLQSFFNRAHLTSFSIKQHHKFVEALDLKISVPSTIVMDTANRYATAAKENITAVKSQISAPNWLASKRPWVSTMGAQGSGYLYSLFALSKFFNMTLFGLTVESGERPELMEEGKF